MTQRERLLTIEDFEAFIARPENANRRFELIYGEIIESVPTEEHGVIALRIGSRILIFVELHDLGRAGVEIRYRLPDDPHNARLPDISFTGKARALPLVRQGAVPQMPDLAVEIASPDDDLDNLRKKIAYYLENGTKLAWLVLPEQQQVEIYRADAERVTLGIEDTLDGGAVLPGFRLSIRYIFQGA